MNKTQKSLSLLLALLFLLCAACTAAPSTGDTSPGATVSPDTSASVGEAAVTHDREGNPITLPDTIRTVISLGPSNTEILVALGAADKLAGIDGYSANVADIPAGLPQFDMFTPDAEQLIALSPDVVFISGMTKVGGGSPYQALEDAGICVAYIPTPDSIAGIYADIRFLAAVMGEFGQGEALVAAMEEDIAAIWNITAAIEPKKTVYFEIAPAPYTSSFGGGTYLAEMLDIAGALNILAGETGWVNVTDEVVLAADPDVIFTNVDYIDNPAGEIAARPGWGVLTAVRTGQIFVLGADATSRPSHHIITPLKDMAAALYLVDFSS